MGKRGNPGRSINHKDFIRNKLISECKVLADTLGRTPFESEFVKDRWKSQYWVDHMFGSWNNFIKECGLNYNRITGTTKDSIAEHIIILAKKVGATPTRDEYMRYAKENNLCSIIVIRRLFGSWTECLKYCHLEPNINYKKWRHYHE